MSRLRRATDVYVQELDGEFLVLRTGSPDVMHLNSTASDVWRLLETDSTPEELAALLAEAYAVPVAQVSSDLRPLLDLLLEQGVVEHRLA